MKLYLLRLKIITPQQKYEAIIKYMFNRDYIGRQKPLINLSLILN